MQVLPHRPAHHSATERSMTTARNSQPSSVRAASARLWPDSTTRTASCLNSSLYRPRFPFLIFVSLSLLHQLAKGYVLRGQAHTSAIQKSTGKVLRFVRR
jgi:hypothetical protein